MEDTRRYSFQPPESAIGPPTRYIFSPSFTVNAVGSIPARAGEPSQASARACASGVYPRACGGTHLPEYPAQPCKGLSPRVRGNLPRPNPHCKGHCKGLSPRVRGNPCSTTSDGARARRSIPARAGEPSPAPQYPAQPVRVYPRACGGTPPRTGAQPRVYPRACGGTAPRISPPCGGLSPRVRGNRSSRNPRVYPRACGGTRLPEYPAQPYKGLSPRVRGNRLPGMGDREGKGLSPRVRGNPSEYPASVRVYAGERDNRSIPARAGEPWVR